MNGPPGPGSGSLGPTHRGRRHAGWVDVRSADPWAGRPAWWRPTSWRWPHSRRAASHSPSPVFGSERTGAPVVAYCRLDERTIRTREPVVSPNALVVIDPTLVHQVDLFSGLAADGYVLIRICPRTFEEVGLATLLGRFRQGDRLLSAPASDSTTAYREIDPQRRSPGWVCRHDSRGVARCGGDGHPGPVQRPAARGRGQCGRGNKSVLTSLESWRQGKAMLGAPTD